MINLVETAQSIIHAAIDAVHPQQLIRSQVRLSDEGFNLADEWFNPGDWRRILVVGMGKASASMALELEGVLAEHIETGLVITKYGHGQPCKKIAIREAGHPLPDANSLLATADMLKLMEAVDQDDLVICLISGGGSSLLEALPDGITLDDLRKTVNELLASGVPIEEINTVQKHLSLVKGGRLAKLIAPARCVNLIISDVIGDPIDAIASGPTAPDHTSAADALAIVDKVKRNNRLPKAVLAYLKEGQRKMGNESVQRGDEAFERVSQHIIGNNRIALAAAALEARKRGFQPLLLSSQIQGEAREVGRVMAGIIREVMDSDQPIGRPACILFGGETTVTLVGAGKGGRNQELALASLIAMENSASNYLVAALGTDGTDGPTDAAGALASPDIWHGARQLNIDPRVYLQNNDAYHFFSACRGLIKTGPTGTNVMDIGLGLIP